MQHKEEILAKKAKLAELRRQREAREQRQKEQGRRESTLGSEESSELRESTPKRHTDRKDLDEFIEKLVGDRPASRGPGTPSPGPRRPRPLSTLSGVQVGAESYEQSSSTASSAVQTSSIATQTDLGEQVGTTTSQAPPQAEQPSKKETYHKFTQTAEEWLPPRRRGSRGNVSDVDSDGSPTELRTPRSSKRLSRRQRVREQELRENLRREIEDELKAARDLTVNGTLTSDAPKFPARGLTNEELDAVTSSEDFLDFIDRSSKVIEKALEQDFDVLADYALDGVEADEDEDEGYVSGRGKKGRRVRQVTQFYDEKWCGKRMICDMCFSPKVNQLRKTALGFAECHSFLNCSSHPTPRMPLLLKIQPASSMYGTCTCNLVPNIPSTPHLTSYPPYSPPFILLSLSVEPIPGKSCSGISEPGLRCQ